MCCFWSDAPTVMREAHEGSDPSLDHPDCTLHNQHLDWKRLVLPLFSTVGKDIDMLGEALRLIRVFHDYKTGELAKTLKISPSYISEIESGKKTPSMETLNKYAEYFETSVSTIMFFAEDLDKDKANPSKSAMRQKLIKFLQVIERATAA